MSRSRSTRLAAAFAAATMLAACSSDPAADDTTTDDTTTDEATVAETTSDEVAADADATLVVYSGRSEELVGPLLERFEEETGIDVAARYAGTAELALQLLEEGDNTDADVFFGQSPGAMQLLDEAGVLAALDADLVASVDAAFRSPDDHWVGVSGRQRVLVYNADLVDEADLPDSVLDVADPDFAFSIGVAPTNGSFQDFVTAMRGDLGDTETTAFLEGLVANDAQTYSGNSSIVEAVGRGEVEVGLVNHYYNLRFLAEDPDLPSRNHVFAGDDVGALVMPAAVAVIEGSDEADEASQLVAFLLSASSQEYFRDETFEYPLVADIAAPAELEPLDATSGPRISITGLGDLAGTVALIDDAGLRE